MWDCTAGEVWHAGAHRHRLRVTRSQQRAPPRAPGTLAPWCRACAPRAQGLCCPGWGWAGRPLCREGGGRHGGREGPWARAQAARCSAAGAAGAPGRRCFGGRSGRPQPGGSAPNRDHGRAALCVPQHARRGVHLRPGSMRRGAQHGVHSAAARRASHHVGPRGGACSTPLTHTPAALPLRNPPTSNRLDRSAKKRGFWQPTTTWVGGGQGSGECRRQGAPASARASVLP